MYYSREQSSLVRDQLLQLGQDGSMGAVVKVVSAQWKGLSAEAKGPYEELAKEDRARYQSQCDARDAQVLAEQEERRQSNQATETSTKMRNSTLSNTEALAVKEAAKSSRAPRQLSAHQQKEKDDRAKLKMAETKRVKKADEELKKVKAEQAEARLKFLLSQSDLFSHFGKSADGKGGGIFDKMAPKDISSARGKNDSKTPFSPGSSRRQINESNQNLAELDADEAAMLEDEEDDEDGTSTSSSKEKKAKKGTILMSQPSIISGGQLRPYQLEGLNWMIRLIENGINGILADEMGLGKTLQSISIIAYQHQHLNVTGPHLVMVPKSTLSNWMNEFKRFCPTIKVMKFHGSKEERATIAEEHLKLSKSDKVREWDVLVTTYEVVNLEKNVLTKIHWRYLIIDEAHRLKNEASQFSQTVRALQTHNRLLLTGTPLQNNLHELWALLNFLLPDVFSSSEQFDEWFNLDVDDTEHKQRIIGQLHKLLRPFMLRRLKVDVEKTLPPKSETILFVGMSAMQKKLYKDILMRDIDTINSGESGKAGRTAVLNIVMQLRKACNHPYLFPGQEDRSLNPLGSHLIENCGKMVLLDKLLKKMKERGHRVLIFSQMTKMIDILEDYFIAKTYDYCRIDGNTTYEEREDRIAAYNKPNSEKFIFVLSTRAGGLGINLQTADTVILFDSDWNPQADLQAQDRAHRIGQKKPVQIFRLVTEDSVEVKVVERAQQKLKLDAMVVQQGRLQEKEKKMSKEELLDTIKFGADKIFRSKESGISDADIDVILEEGRKKTLEMSSKLESAEKGDMYDFRLDGGMKAQEFDGVDYSDRTTRDAETAALAQLAFIDPGKRERKVVASYAESMQAAKSFTGEEADRKPKMPRHLRLPRMDDWQFYNKQRLEELHAIEETKFEEMVEKGEYPIAGNVSKLVILEEALHAEKESLLNEGFKEWTRVTFNQFIKCSAKHGRNDYEKIAKDMYLETEDVERYATKFWTVGEEHLGQEEYQSKVKSIEKGEKAVEETNRLQEATSKLIQKFDDPWNELTFRYTGGATRVFNQDEDRFLLCLTHLHGYGNWERVRTSIRQSDHFRFDFYINSLTEEQIAKRCDTLMKSAERELLEIEKKEKGDSSSASLKKSTSATSLINGNGSSSTSISGPIAPAVTVKDESAMDIALDPGSTTSNSKNGTNENITPPAPVVVEKVAKIKQEVPKDEGTLLKEIRIKLDNKLKSLGQLREQLRLAKDPSIALGKGPISAKGASAKSGAGAKSKTASAKTTGKSGKGGGKVATAVPEHMLPALTQYIEANASWNLDALKTNFHDENPTIPKRQIEMKIQEMTEKKSGPKDTYRLKPEFKKYVTMKASDFAAKAAPPKKRKATSTAGSTKVAKTVPDTTTTTTTNNNTSTTSTTTATSSTTGSSTEPAQKKVKKDLNGFQLFVKEKKKELQPQIQSENPDADATTVKNLLKPKIADMWKELSDEEKARYDLLADAAASVPDTPVTQATATATTIQTAPTAIST